MQTRSWRWGQSWSKLNVGSKSRRSSRSCHLTCNHQRSESWDVVGERTRRSMLKMWIYIHNAIWLAITRGLKFQFFWKTSNEQCAQCNITNGLEWSTKWLHPSKYLGSRVPCWQDFKKKYLKVAFFCIATSSSEFSMGICMQMPSLTNIQQTKISAQFHKKTDWK